MPRSEFAFSHKGYQGNIHRTLEGSYRGKVMGIKDVVTYEGDNLLDLLSQFQLSVDSYLEFCAEIGKEPDKPKKVRT